MTSILNSNVPLVKSPIFIMGCPKSGTTLLPALLDGHPELLVFPIEIKFFWYTKHPTLLPEMKVCWETDVMEAAKRIVNGYFFEFLLNRDDPPLPVGMKKSPNFSLVDPEKFKASFNDLSEASTYQDLFVYFFQALFISCGMSVEKIKDYHIVEKTPLQEEHALLLKQWFPNAKFIHIIRNPYATFCALRKRASRSAYPYLRTIVKQIWLSDYFRQRNQLFIKNYMTLLYEDLVTCPEETMRKICAFLGIKYQDSLLQPTYLGKPWSGNSMYGSSFSGIDPSPLENWKKEITSFEISLVNRKLESIFTTFKYPLLVSGSKLKVYLPQRKEGLLRYIANRILFKYKWFP